MGKKNAKAAPDTASSAAKPHAGTNPEGAGAAVAIDTVTLEATPLAPPFEDLIELSRDLQAIGNATLDPIARTYGLNRLALFTLLNLDRLPDQTPSHLSAVLHAKRTNIASTLRNLEYKGLITIGASEADKRHRLVNLTEKGREVALAAEAELNDARTALLDRVPTESIEQLMAAWQTFRTIAHDVAASVEGANAS